MEHKYICVHRPAMPGSVPSDGLMGIVDADKRAKGYYSLVTYSRELTDKEVFDYELQRIDYTTT